MPQLRTIRSLSVTRAAAVSATRLDLSCSPDEDDVGTHFTRLLRYDSGVWTMEDISQQAESLCQCHDRVGKTSLLVMSREGNLIDVDGGGPATKVEDVTLRGKPYQLGFLNKLRQVGSTLYAAGSGGQTYCREGNGAWRILSEELLDGPYPNRNWILEYLNDPKLLDDPEVERQAAERVKSENPRLFWTLAGTSEKSIYFGGEQAKGLLYFWDGACFTLCDLPTDKAIRDIMIAPDGTVWICGREGILLKGHNHRFEVVVDLGSVPRFASLAWFNDRLYIGSSSGPSALFAFDGQGAQPVGTGLPTELVDAHTIQSVGSALWVVGAKSLARFDGQKWERIPVPGVGD